MTHPQAAFLYQLFTALRRADFPLGIDDYLTALRAIEGGFGLADEVALRRLCAMLWLKTERQADLFARIFEQQLAITATAIQPEKPDPEPAPLDQLAAPPEADSSVPPPQPAPPPPHMAGKVQPEDTASLAFNASEAIAKIQLDQQAIERAPRSRYLLKPTNLPVTLRQMKRQWRYLRRYRRSGPATELDVTATIRQVGQQGYLSQAVMRPRRTNQTRLLLLLDQAGSMAPFHLFSRQLLDSATQGGQLAGAWVYYFHDVPLNHLYTDSARLYGVDLREMVASLPTGTMALIFSDAGAARQSYEVERILQTERFISQLKPQVSRAVWLNPLPNERWPGSSAAEIARLMPMFELSQAGLDEAINALNGRGIYWEKRYAWMRA